MNLPPCLKSECLLLPVVLALGTVAVQLVSAGPAASSGVTPPVPATGPAEQAPPPPPAIQTRPETGSSTVRPFGLSGTLYSVGQPTDEEQLYLEYLNRMRANPSAEGLRLATTTDADVLSAYSFFSVNLALMQGEFNTNPAVPPLAMNAQLMAAARWHSGDMFTNQYQGHYQTNGSIVMDPGNRMTTNGYNWSTYGENVYSYAKSVPHGHAGFAVDWGGSAATGGMQSPPGHRNNMFYPGFREVGMGVFDGVNGTVGPQLITQDLGTRQGATPLLLGVVYYDFNTNGFYDIGEGIGGVTVSTPGSGYYAVTADSGGFALPVTSNGVYTLTFTANGLTNQSVLAVTSLQNAKVDYVPLYSPPLISGPNPAGVNQSNYFTFTPVGAASSYQWQQTQLSPYTYVEGAENGLANVTVASSAGYAVQTSDLKHSGTYSFHLAQPDGTSQYLTLNAVLRPSNTSQLTFYKYLGYAATAQVAKAQVSSDGGATWQDVWSQAGNGSSTDSAFVAVNVALAAYAGQSIQVRFAYLFSTGSYFPQTSSGIGFYVDDIAVSGASQVANPVITTIASGTSFGFTPTNTGSFLLQARARINSRTLPWGPAFSLSVSTPPPAVGFVTVPSISGNQVTIDFTVANYRAGMTLQLWKASDPSGPWTQDAAAALQTLVANSKFRLSTSTGGAGRTFYRVKGSY